MCGRFVQAQPAQSYADHFGATLAVPEALDPSWNVAPTDEVYAIAQHEGTRTLGKFRWGLIPWYSDSPKVASKHINARAETVASKPAFKDSFARRRCIVPADGFYEWERLEAGGKLPHYIHSSDGSPLALAGLWASWRDGEGVRLTSCTIVTTEPNELVGKIHNRMPVVLPGDAWEAWLDPAFADQSRLRGLLVASPADRLTEHAVSTLVNDVKNNYLECVAPLR
ncbi:MAG: SOS response-associated peptidase [Acidimicrobiia bacterium]